MWCGCRIAYIESSKSFLRFDHSVPEIVVFIAVGALDSIKRHHVDLLKVGCVALMLFGCLVTQGANGFPHPFSAALKLEHLWF